MNVASDSLRLISPNAIQLRNLESQVKTISFSLPLRKGDVSMPDKNIVEQPAFYLKRTYQKDSTFAQSTLAS
ncbi:hypothetical protein EXN66_Car014875 [Channa argus]|uniref:Uncharacterized protein n=1 Tax=Channa argus TaxID=215402 RepID=A0A6G1QA93_CHAAH|nr:hypothetical protein EXN66_Car014875 [Channa argus]